MKQGMCPDVNWQELLSFPLLLTIVVALGQNLPNIIMPRWEYLIQ